MTTTETKHPGQGSTDTPISIAEIWQRWLALTDRYHAASTPNPNTRAAQHAYGAAKLVALCLACIPAASMEDVRPKVVVLAWLRQYGDASHVEIMIEAAISADHVALQPSIDRDLH